MNIREFHTAVVSLCREVSSDAKLDETRAQQIRDEVEWLRQQNDLLLDFGYAYQWSGVRQQTICSLGVIRLGGTLSKYEDATGRIYGKYVSTHEAALAEILGGLDEAEQPTEWDDLIDDMRTEVLHLETNSAVSAATTAVGSTATAEPARTPKPDGPCGNRKWRHDGQETSAQMQEKTFLLAAYLCERLDTRVDIRHLKDLPQFADTDSDSICAQGRKIKRFFADNAVPLSVETSRRDEYLIMTRTEKSAEIRQKSAPGTRPVRAE